MITAYPPSIGGAQLHHHMLNRHLVGLGHEVHVASVWRAQRDDWLRGTTILAPPPSPPDIVDGVIVHNLGLAQSSRLASAPLALAYYAAMRTVGPALSRLYEEHARSLVDLVRPDVAHLSRIGREWFYEAFVRVLTERGVPIVLTPYHHPHWTRRRDWWWWTIYRRADAVNVFTDAERVQLVAGGVEENRITRVPSGPVERPAGPIGVPEGSDAPVVLFLGQIKPYKGLSVIYESMRSVWRERPTARLVVVGPWASERRGLRRELDGDERVEVLGAVPSDLKWAQLARANVLCLPSTQESLGIVYLEAWQLAKPVIGADIPPVKELFERTGGGLAVAQRPDAIAEALLKVLGDRDLARQLGSAGRRAVETVYNWEVAARRTQSVYRSLVGSSS